MDRRPRSSRGPGVTTHRRRGSASGGRRGRLRAVCQCGIRSQRRRRDVPVAGRLHLLRHGARRTRYERDAPLHAVPARPGANPAARSARYEHSGLGPHTGQRAGDERVDDQERPRPGGARDHRARTSRRPSRRSTSSGRCAIRSGSARADTEPVGLRGSGPGNAVAVLGRLRRRLHREGGRLAARPAGRAAQHDPDREQAWGRERRGDRQGPGGQHADGRTRRPRHGLRW